LSTVVEELAEAIKNGGRVMNSKNRFAWRIEVDQIGVPDVIGIMWYEQRILEKILPKKFPFDQQAKLFV